MTTKIERLGKKVFLREMKRLESAFDHKANEAQLGVYFNKMSDITDSEFCQIVEKLLENEFRWPPIAAFYKYKSEVCLCTISPEQSAAIRRVREKYENRGD